MLVHVIATFHDDNGVSSFSVKLFSFIRSIDVRIRNLGR